MIITLHGQDAYRRKKKLEELVTSFLKKNSSLAYEIIDALDDNAFQKASVFLATTSLFQDSKLIVLKNWISELNHTSLKSLFKNILNDKTVVIISDETDKITKDIQFLSAKPNLVQEFKKLGAGDFSEFIHQESKKRNMNLEAKIIEYLSRAFNGDSWGVTEELNKLSLINSSPITLDLLKNCGIFIENDFFSYISGWFRKSYIEKLATLERLFNFKNDSAKIFNILAYQDPGQIRRFADYDIEIKSGKIEYNEALLELSLQ